MFVPLWNWFQEPDHELFIILIVSSFIIGFAFGHLKNRKIGTEKKIKTDAAFFKGIQYILSNDRDQAIEEFTKSVQINSDTIETYVALGNLYRLKGDIDRAIHIRQTIILRPNIDEQIKIRALIDLGIDYRKGGFLNRALSIFFEVLKTEANNLETLQEIERIYEDLKDWINAFTTRQKIARLMEGNHNNILAHHQTEIGKAYVEEGKQTLAQAAFKRAISIDPGCIDAYLHLGDLYFKNQEYKKAIDAWKKVVSMSPHFTFLAYRRLEGAYLQMKNLRPVEEFLKECAQFNSDAFTHLALARYLYNEQDYDGAIKELRSALKLDPFFWEARRFMGELLLEQNRNAEAVQAYRELIPYLNFQYMEFQCSNCGFVPTDLQWQCPQCRKWDSINFMGSKTSGSLPEPRVHDNFLELFNAEPGEK
ncbi:MAG: tetratricopeptide repeat protein [Deltaproteobacteria bacterium]|nr:tetratricopeptide repeat protein [Deltaproteobacteria bacterium]